MNKQLPMSLQQLDHLDILRRAERREITRMKAAGLLNLTDRTIRRQLKHLEEDGPVFLQHGLRGRVSNNRMPRTEEEKIKKILLSRYPDFHPTFAAEKLSEIHGMERDPKTIARIQIGLGLHKPRKNRKKSGHRFFRVRRSVFGELIQFDGSYHDWFEGRGGIGEVCLLLAIDDATGRITYASFAPHEGVLPVMGFWLEYARIQGIPQSVYLDRFSTYSMNVKLAGENPDTLTQFERAAKEAGLKVIHAYSSQAKGRVERVFGTLQDRLVKEMRLAGISTMEEADRFLQETFIPDFNGKFAVPSRSQGNLHRTVSKSELEDILPFIFCRREGRTIQNDFTVSFKRQWLQLLPTPRLAMRPKERVEVHQLPDESLRVLVRGKEANFHPLPEKAISHSRRPMYQTIKT